VVQQVYSSLKGHGDSRCDVKYDGYHLKLDVLFHTDVKPEYAVAGEIFKAGIIVRAADDGSGSIRISTELYRNLCLNLIIIDFDKVLVGKRRHAGKNKDIGTKITEYLASADEKLSYFMKAWSGANQENILTKYNLADISTVFLGLTGNGVVKVPGVRPEDLSTMLMSSWQKEPGNTKASVINAITRTAHEATWHTVDTAENLESLAGELLFAKSWDCVPQGNRTVAQVLGV
jgi:hypothetical protein